MSSSISDTLLTIAEEHATEEQLQKMLKESEGELETILCDIKTLGQLLLAAHESEELSTSDDLMSSYLVINHGEEAQELNILISNLKYYIKHKQDGTVPETRRVNHD